jgi:mono/diheme cytochrome c family protein
MSTRHLPALRSLLALSAVAALGALGCRGQTSEETQIVIQPNMFHQPRYNIQSESAFFADKRTMRPRVEGTVGRSESIDPRIAEGRLEDGSGYVLTIPDEVVKGAGGLEALTEHGKGRFGIYCVPCHDGTGSGQGIVIKHGMIAPPTFHQDRLRKMPDGQVFATISNGIRNMPAYNQQIPEGDRWSIVAYVRALQVSQAPLAAEMKK